MSALENHGLRRKSTKLVKSITFAIDFHRSGENDQIKPFWDGLEKIVDMRSLVDKKWNGMVVDYNVQCEICLHTSNLKDFSKFLTRE